ncbi:MULTISPECIES: hypothetical protein [Sorangium]|uniref:Uncharacterized protein n=1 Tax=Sorangium cellulosum (strain So ce56) TaxID=448385 RepID=A9F8E1_SORC5|nr:hypothetical protein [Sorangium cellulosum]CAN94648.1 hypothetical protein predicted by Glimmer/Critica [Sorangium cellulosum So ce56]
MALDQTALAAPAARTTVRKALADDIAKNRPILGAHVNGRLVDLHLHTPFHFDDSARIGLVRTSAPDGPSANAVAAPRSRDLDEALGAMPLAELADRRAAARKLHRLAVSTSGS